MPKVEFEGLGSVDFSALPSASQEALISRAVAHLFGNEVASRVHAFALKTVKGDSKEEPSKEAIKNWKTANPDAIAAKTTEVQAEKWKALIDGTLGVSTAGPRLSPVESVARQIARKEILGILSAHKIKAPTGENTIEMKGERFTMGQLIDRRLAHEVEGARIAKEAEKQVRAAAAKAKSVAETASGAEVGDLL